MDGDLNDNESIAKMSTMKMVNMFVKKLLHLYIMGLVNRSETVRQHIYPGKYNEFTGQTSSARLYNEAETTEQRHQETVSLIKIKSKGITCIFYNWQEYNPNLRTVRAAYEDLVLTEHPSFPRRIFAHSARKNTHFQGDVDESEVSAFSKFDKTVLKPTGYEVIILTF